MMQRRGSAKLVRDDVLSSRAVKYVAAIERILTAERQKHIEKTISIRAADLLFDHKRPRGWEDNKNKILTAYKLRSDLLHGAISPHDEIVAQGINNCGDIAEDILRIILFRLGKDALLMEEASDKRYKNWLDRIREHVASMMPPVEPH
ncbi:MAG: hypothetical protein H6844_14805 [Alphaproteobacteria bacterium]|nr:hypothetical protein [Alphaproteobacteria bacterium]